MTTFLLIRHAEHELGVQTIAGRRPGVRLSPRGRDQAASLAQRLSPLPIRALYSSPADRTRETAQSLSQALSLPVQVSDGLAEIDFGDWTGRTLDQLEPLPDWQRWNRLRSLTGTPRGEHMLQAQTRAVLELARLHARHPDDHVALVTHGDVIRAALAHLLGVHLDLFQRLEIGLASVSVASLTGDGPKVLCVNHTAETPTL